MGYRKIDNSELEKEFGPKQIVPLTPQGLERFEAWLQPFYEEREVEKMDRSGEMETVRVLNVNEAATAYGAMKKTMYQGHPQYAIRVKVLDEDQHGRVKAYERPTPYERFQALLEQREREHEKREYAIRMRDGEYEEMAAQVGQDLPDEVVVEL